MNTIIEFINSLGTWFWQHSTAMLIQSSILIVLLLIVDFIIKKRVRAVVRYGLWLLLVVKLMLPATLSTALSIGNLVGHFSKPELVQSVSKIDNDSITSAVAPTSLNASSSAFNLAPVQSVLSANHEAPAASIVTKSISWQGFLFIGWFLGLVFLLSLLIQRLYFVKSLIGQAVKVDDLPVSSNSLSENELNQIFNDCCQTMKLSPKKISLKISPNPISPAVCGFIHSTILFPSYLIETVNATQLRSVFLHELSHIKRHDLKVNVLQTLLQIVYFYNPLLWIANAIIRQVREQAVDESVLVALGTDAPSYSHTLLDIAEMAFQRPSLSLRLIGVVESKKALSQRIKHILTRPLPKSARVGILSLCTIAISACIILPMGKSIKETYNSGSFKKQLPDGVEGRLVAVSYISTPMEARWKPDGTPLKDLFSGEVTCRQISTNENQYYYLKCDQYENGKYVTSQTLTTKLKSDKKRAFWDVFNKDNDQPEHTFTLAYGEWQPYKVLKHAKFDGKWESEDGELEDEIFMFFPDDWKKNTHALMYFNKSKKYTLKFRAIDHDGKECYVKEGGYMPGYFNCTNDVHYVLFSSSNVSRIKIYKKPIHKVTFKNVALHPDMKKKPQVFPDVDNIRYTVRLPNKATVSLVGIESAPARSNNWNYPNGSWRHLSISRNSTFNQLENGRKAFDIAYLPRLPDNMMSGSVVGLSMSNAVASYRSKVKNLEIESVLLEENQKINDVTIYVGGGEYSPVLVSTGNETNIFVQNKTVSISQIKQWAHIVNVVLDYPQTGFSLAEMRGDAPRTIWNTCAFRFIAVDKSGKTHHLERSRRMTREINQISERFYIVDLPLSEIKEFRYECTPYQSVTYKNVSFDGGSTEVETEICAPYLDLIGVGVDISKPINIDSSEFTPVKRLVVSQDKVDNNGNCFIDFDAGKIYKPEFEYRFSNMTSKQRKWFIDNGIDMTIQLSPTKWETSGLGSTIQLLDSNKWYQATADVIRKFSESKAYNSNAWWEIRHPINDNVYIVRTREQKLGKVFLDRLLLIL